MMCVVITSVSLNCWNVPGEDIIIGHGWVDAIFISAVYLLVWSVLFGSVCAGLGLEATDVSCCCWLLLDVLRGGGAKDRSMNCR